ncbi:MAG: zinc-ribbon domain-containing protein [Anaerolineae bacterium]|nr:zinc-ribbon domain-containing protein [Anaerolineae bacterium]MDW8098988.1 zinc-ribbon domain-containing protein [Anaerolineae bacterium]
MSSVRRICPRCGKPHLVDATQCPHCGHPTDAPLAASSGRQPMQALLGQVAVPVALGAISLAVRAGIYLFQRFLRHTWPPPDRPDVAQRGDSERVIVVDFWGRREIVDHRGRSMREQTRARWEIRR